MKVVGRSQAAETLSVIADLIHDRWFDIAGVVLDEATRTLRIPFDPIARALASSAQLAPERSQVLEIRRARALQVDDTERVGRYDFDALEWNRETHTVTVRTGVPVTIRVEVDELDVAVLEPYR